MKNFEDFYNELLLLITKYEKSNVSIKVEKNIENEIIKIFGEKITSISRAKSGANDVSELAYATAEHHPFWNLLYNSSEISNIVLEKWQESLTQDDLDDLAWALKELSNALEKIKR